MLNSIGLQNPGRERFLAETLPRLLELGVPVWVSVGGFSATEYAETCAALDDDRRRRARAEPLLPERRRGARGRRRDRRRLPRGDGASRSTRSSRPPHWDLGEVARAAQAAGADGLSLVNTMRGLALDPRTLEPRLARGAGGYSGPGAAARRARRRARVLPRDRRHADRRDGRRRDRTRRARARRGGRLGGRARDDPVRRPGRPGARPRRARGGAAPAAGRLEDAADSRTTCRAVSAVLSTTAGQNAWKYRFKCLTRAARRC